MKPKKTTLYATETINARVRRMLDARNELPDVGSLHVKVCKGNSKTGAACWTVSLLPIVDCGNCAGCKQQCYDVAHDMIYKNVIMSRAINSAIHAADSERYFREIEAAIVLNGITELRYNVGGDFMRDDFFKANMVAKRNKATDFMCFTKNYAEANEALDYLGGKFSDNFHVIYSAWKGMEMCNPYHQPESHVLYADGTTTAPEFGAYYCSGNCSVCHFHKANGNKTKSGCWGLTNGEHVIFPYH